MWDSPSPRLRQSLVSAPVARGRKEKQRIGEDPRNTRWLKNESNPGLKILSSMGWSSSSPSLGLAALSGTSEKPSWKRLPTANLPVLKSTTSGLGANPAQSISYVLRAPQFVRGSQAVISSSQDSPDLSTHVEDDKERASKLSITANGGNGGGFDDLLSRLNRRQKEAAPSSTEENQDSSFVLVASGTAEEEINQTNSDKPKKKKRVRIIEECQSEPPPKKKLKLSGLKHEKRRKKRHGLSSNLPSNTLSLTGSKSELSDDGLVATSSGPVKISRPFNPRMAARNKFINSKKLATSCNSVAMAEILGIPPA
ncbi:hypothetical protein O181_062446 [Austropuccinia psidii MF-1]|uniref:Uncharacterized protein n=1 Tax=Austropuccinia psidii MF-1 TaxID=1389203 RepID=A0A9Q3HYF6_9BASI|nr:hypothetical protein [Austropuccinia psidii MF-1]